MYDVANAYGPSHVELSFDSFIVAGFGPPPLFASDSVTVVEFV